MTQLVNNVGFRRLRNAVAIVACAGMLVACVLSEAAGVRRVAYIGPGAGIALAGSLLAIVSAMFSALIAIVTLPIRALWHLIRGRSSMRKARVKRVIVLGLDGLEPSLTEKFMEEGLLPNLAKLREQGSYRRLGTTWPPLSPVAWSSFSTGVNPGKHNIFDFIARTHDYHPMISSVRIREPRKKLKLGSWVIPISKPEITALRKSKPFWAVLGEHGVFSSIIRVPITFPPDKFNGLQLSAMCVPDLRGSQGIFSYFAEEGEVGATTEGDVGGDRILVQRVNPDEVRSYLRGPRNSLRAECNEMRLPFRVIAATSKNGDESERATLVVGDEKVPLKVGAFTPWVTVRFNAAPGIKVNGVCRFYLKRLAKPFELYCTPVQIDPDKPVMPIAHPTVFSSYLSRKIGPYSTLGLAEDTWSLSEKLMSEEAFLEQAYDIHEERRRMFVDALDRIKRGMIVCVFDGPDRIQHMFWRFFDNKHPAATDKEREIHRNVIRDMYVRMDKLVGETMAQVDKNTALFVMSDHGFKTFRRGVDLNAWLRDNGYLKVKDGARVTERPYLQDIDWSHTQAYAVGLAGIFLNLKGREKNGQVEKADAVALAQEIATKLTGLKDPQNDEVAVFEALPRANAYKGPYTENAPDVLVGYNVGYRVSWDAAIGKCGEPVVSDNLKAWSGDHCVHPSLAPGVLFSNMPLRDGASIIDLAPTALELFGIKRQTYMDGNSLLCEKPDPKGPPKAAPQPVAASA
ncbi:MAG: alkaline phosphatase family protein [Phycisphaerales bacterium]|nr:alkaline phosphatase family protein [Phycisphaerales bacterium]